MATRDLYTLKPDQIEFGDVVEFCSHQTRENVRLDYKQEFSSKDARRQVARAVAAFANTQGGLIIFGVEEEADRTPSQSPKGMKLGNDPDDAVLSRCTHNIFPPVSPEVSPYLANPDNPNIGFLVVRVPVSEDVHTIDGGTGIYHRVRDKSEPVQADIEKIEWFIRRRQKSVDLQEQRRERARSQLWELLPEDFKRPEIWVSLGPRVITEPLFELRELREQVPNLSIPSVYSCRARFPVDRPDSDMRSTDEAVYSQRGTSDVKYEGGWAGMVDVYGNVTMLANVSSEVARPVWVPAEVSLQPGDGGLILAFDVSLVVERILCVLEHADALYRHVGFVGNLDFKFMARGIQRLSLGVYLWGRRGKHLAHSPLRDTLPVNDTFVTEYLHNNTREILCGLTERILWGWGYMQLEIVEQIVDAAEILHFGPAKCPGCGGEFPVGRDRCRQCTEKG